MSGVILGHVLDMFGAYFGFVLDMFWTSFGHVLDVCCVICLTSFLQYLGNIPDSCFAKVLLNYFRQPYQRLAAKYHGDKRDAATLMIGRAPEDQRAPGGGVALCIKHPPSHSSSTYTGVFYTWSARPGCFCCLVQNHVIIIPYGVHACPAVQNTHATSMFSGTLSALAMAMANAMAMAMAMAKAMAMAMAMAMAFTELCPGLYKAYATSMF